MKLLQFVSLQCIITFLVKTFFSCSDNGSEKKLYSYSNSIMRLKLQIFQPYKPFGCGWKHMQCSFLKIQFLFWTCSWGGVSCKKHVENSLDYWNLFKHSIFSCDRSQLLEDTNWNFLVRYVWKYLDGRNLRKVDRGNDWLRDSFQYFVQIFDTTNV